MATTAPSTDRAFFGHPKGLLTLFILEMWERFSFYGMRAFLVIFIATSAEDGGLGETKATAGIIYALYGSLVYLMSLPGGWIADRFIGQQRAVLYGGIIIMFGHVVLAIPSHDTFYLGLVLIVLGTGLLKPNASTIVGQLYDKSDIRRDAGYSIFYMGINLGAFIAPFVCGYLAQDPDFQGWLFSKDIDPNSAWHYGFGAAAVGMFLGVACFAAMRRHLGAAGRDPAPPKPPAERRPIPSGVWAIIGAAAAVTLAFGLWRAQTPYSLWKVGLDKAMVADIFGIGLAAVAVAVFLVMYKAVAVDRDEKNRVLAMAVLFFGCLSFFGIFEQAGSTLSFFAEERMQQQVLGIDFPSSYWQSVNAAWVIALAPVFAFLWVFLAKRNQEPFSVNKFAIGMVIAGIAFVPLLFATPTIFSAGQRSSAGLLLTYYFFATCAEMCISPVGLSVMNKLAPQRLAGFVMGVWFLAISIGLYIAGRAEVEVGKVAENLDMGTSGTFYLIMLFAFVVAGILFAAAGPVRRMLNSTPPLPQAKAQ